jgi:hypothetical protein
MGETTTEAAYLASWLAGDRGDAGREVMDQLWLRTLLISFKRGRSQFDKDEIDRRGDAILARLER